MGEPGCLPTRLRARGESGVCSQAPAVPHRSPLPWPPHEPSPAAVPAAGPGSSAWRFGHHGGSTTAAQRKPRHARLPGRGRQRGPAARRSRSRHRQRWDLPAQAAALTRREGERSRAGVPAGPRPAEPPSRRRSSIARRRGGSSALGAGRRPGPGVEGRIGRRGQREKEREGGWESGAGGCRQRPS